MLKLPARRAIALKCPRHPRAQYTKRATPYTCGACEALACVLDAYAALDLAERNAAAWIARTRPPGPPPKEAA